MVVTRRGEDRPTVTEAFRAGSEQALAEVYVCWSPLVYSIALGSLGDVTDAEEVTQRVFTGAWTSRQSFDPTRSRLSAWLIGITRATIADAQTARRDPARPGTRAALTQPDAESEPADLADRLVLADAISRLESAPRQVLRMALDDDLSHGEIAARTGLPPATVRSHILDSLQKLRSRLEVLADAH